MKALICGGGIGGLSAAIALKYVGCDVSVFEQADRLREVGAGITLWSNAIIALRKMGAADAVLNAGYVPLTEGSLRTSRGKLLVEAQQAEVARRTGAPTIAIHRGRLLDALAQAFGEAVQTDARCVAFEQDESGVTVRLSDGGKVRGDLLVGADGIHSEIRAQLHGPTPPRYAGYLAWRAVVEFSHPAYPEGHAGISLGPGAQFGILPLGGGDVYWFGTMNAPAGSTTENVKEELARQFAGWHEPIETLIEITDDSAVLRADILDHRPLVSWGTGRVTLLGASAHATTPNLGQGACQAIEDAVELAWCLSQTTDVSRALRTYELRRIPRTTRVVRDSWRAGRAFQYENALACWCRNQLIKLIPGSSQTNRMLVYAGYEVPDLERLKCCGPERRRM